MNHDTTAPLSPVLHRYDHLALRRIHTNPDGSRIGPRRRQEVTLSRARQQRSHHGVRVPSRRRSAGGADDILTHLPWFDKEDCMVSLS